MLDSIEVIATHNFTQNSVKEAILKQGTSGSAGYDLFLCQIVLPNGNYSDFDHFSLYPNTSQKFTTGLQIHIGDKNFVGKIYPRSGKGSKGLVLGNLTGVIDSDYTGEIILSVWNRTDEIKKILPGEAVAQLIFERVYHPEFKFVTEFSKATARGTNGFGSTDLQQ